MAESGNNRCHILVVDDEPSVCKAMQMMLTYDGHQVNTACDGTEALALFNSGPFDLVITDYLMPEMRGDQLVCELKKLHPSQRIILVTAFAEDFTSYGKPTGGADLVLNKPFSLEELRAAIAKVMSS
jgi:DNA-binding response OmpR family regulator